MGQLCECVCVRAVGACVTGVLPANPQPLSTTSRHQPPTHHPPPPLLTRRSSGGRNAACFTPPLFLGFSISPSLPPTHSSPLVLLTCRPPLSSLRSPGTWASLVPFQVSNGTPILPTNVHQNYSINIIGEPLVPAETGN